MLMAKTAEDVEQPAPRRRSREGCTTPSTNRALLVFTRSPKAEARAKQLPLEPGTRLFEAFLRSWRRRAMVASADLMVVAPPSSVAELQRLLPGDRIVPQEGASFGARVEFAFALAFRGGADSVLMVSGDSPPLEPEEVNEAFAHLEGSSHAMALAPARDGGVNAIGFGANAARPLACLPWLSPLICGQLKLLAERLGLAVLLTQPGNDLDCAQDVRALYRLSLIDRRWIPFRWLLHPLCHPLRGAAPHAASLTSRWRAGASVTRGPPVFVS